MDVFRNSGERFLPSFPRAAAFNLMGVRDRSTRAEGVGRSARLCKEH